MKKLIPLIVLMIMAFASQVEAQKGAKMKIKTQKLLKAYFDAAANNDTKGMLELMDVEKGWIRDSMFYLKDSPYFKAIQQSFQQNATVGIYRFPEKQEVPGWIRDSMFIAVIPLTPETIKNHANVLPDFDLYSIFLGPVIGTIIPETPIPSDNTIPGTDVPFSKIMFETFMEVSNKAYTKKTSVAYLIITMENNAKLKVYAGNGRID